MKTPTIEEVKEYFKNAKEIEDFTGDIGFFDNVNLEITFQESIVQNVLKKNWITLWIKREGYAKIISYKENMKFEITKEQLKSIKDPIVKEWFPEALKTDLEVGKWYKDIESKLMYFILEIKDKNNINAYGFDSAGFYSAPNGNYEWGAFYNYREATTEEVFEALKNEAVKLGFVKGVYYKNASGNNGEVYELKGNDFKMGFLGRNNLHESNSHGIIFEQGKWATIIPTISKEEAEKKLNNEFKII